MKMNTTLLVLLTVFLFVSCDPSGGPAIINKYPYPVKITFVFSDSDEINKKTVILQPGVYYYPGARNKNQRNIIELTVKKEDGINLLTISKDKIEELLLKNGKGYGVFIISKDGLTIEKTSK